MFTDSTSFYTLINNLLRVSQVLPPNELQIRCFGVIDHFAIIQDEQLGKQLLDKDRPYFYSQLWRSKKYSSNEINFDYPLLAIRESSVNTTDPFTTAKKSTMSYDILLVDKMYLDQSEQTNVLKRRNQYQIYDDCRTLLKQFLETLTTVKAYTYNSEIIYLPSTYVDNLVDSSAFVLDENLSMKFLNKLKLTNDYTVENFAGTGNVLYGVNISNFSVWIDPCVTDIIPMRNDIVPLL